MIKNALIFVLSFTASLGLAQKKNDSLKTIQYDEVVFTGQFEPQSLSKSVYQVRTIGQEIIKARNATNIQTVLNTQVGIRFSNDMTLGTSDITLMGMSGQSVKILLDGVPVFDRGSTRESLNQIDINTIERIEIVEGPMSVVYGSDALAGVINLITKKAAATQNKLSITSRILEETAGDEYDAFTKDGVHQENVNVLWKGKAWNTSVGASRNNFGGWLGSGEGRAKQWFPKDQWLGNASVGYQKNDFNIWYRLNYLNEEIHSLGAPNPNTNVATDKDYISNRFNHQVQAEWKLKDDWTVTGMASYQDYTRRTQTTTINLNTGDRRLTTGQGEQDKAEFRDVVFRGISVNKLSSIVSLQSGIDVNLSEGYGARIDGDRTINDYALFVSTEITPASKFSIRPGLRFIYNSVYDAPPVIPSLNGKLSLNDHLDLRASYGYGFRAPALRELYFKFIDANHTIIGNPDLKAEHSNSFSASLSNRANIGSASRLNSTLGVFYNFIENQINLATDPADNSTTRYFNIDKSRTAGGTFNNTFYWKNLTASLGFSYIGMFNIYSEDDSSLPTLLYTPEVNSNISYTFDKINATVSIFYKITGKRSYYESVTDSNNEQVYHLAETAKYQWADITVSKRINQYIELSGGVKNLFDITNLQNTAQSSGDAHSSTGPTPMSYGRSYFLGLNLQWNK